MKVLPVLFEQHEIRRVYDEKAETWYFSVVDIIQVLTQQPDFQAARNYWKVLKNRLGKEGSEVVTNCNRLKLPADDGKMRLTDVTSAETLLHHCGAVVRGRIVAGPFWEKDDRNERDRNERFAN